MTWKFHKRWFACALSALTVASARALAQEPRDTAREFMAHCEAQDLDGVARRLRAREPEFLRACVALVIDGDASVSTAGRGAVLRVLAEHLPLLRAQLIELSGANAAPERIAGALSVLGEVGEARDLNFALQLALSTPRAPADGDVDTFEELDPTSAALRAALASIVRRCKPQPSVLNALIAAGTNAYTPVVVEAFAASGVREAVDLLAELLRANYGRRAATVIALGRAALATPPPFEQRACAAVRALLDHPDADGFREAVICVGRLDDEGAAARLVELLDADDAGVRADAHWSLRRITGARFSMQRAHWSRWLHDESQWWSERAPDLFDALDSADARESATALNELLRHRFPRHELAPALAKSLPQLEGAAFDAVCVAIAQLGSRAPTALLAELDERETNAARRASLGACRARLQSMGAAAPKPVR